LSSQRLLLNSFTGDDARESFEAATPTVAALRLAESLGGRIIGTRILRKAAASNAPKLFIEFQPVVIG
jgi:hypothetical protein